MTAEAKALLDELMGRTRNLDPSQQSQDFKWDSEEVCRYFLCGFCPHQLFTNTRADLGTCSKIHDEALRKAYQRDPRHEKCGYEDDFIRFLSSLIGDVEKRIRRGHQRLALNSQQGNLNGVPLTPQEEKIAMLTEKINELVVQAEELGCEGKVEEAQGVMKLADQLKEERTQLQNLNAQETDGPLMKQMEVCEVCGAFLIVGDAPQRQDEHLMGKQHAGYAQVRAEIEKRKKKVREELEAKEANELKLKKEREDREKERQKEREERRQREKDRVKEREKRRKSRSHSRDRRRSRSRDRKSRGGTNRDRRSRRSRSRSKDRRRRSRSGSRNKRSSKRSHSRDRKSGRQRSRDRRSRSRHRSKSKDRHDKRRDKDDKSKKKTPEVKQTTNGDGVKQGEEPVENEIPKEGGVAVEAKDGNEEKTETVSEMDHKSEGDTTNINE